MTKIAAVILAGGKSSRMGQDKAKLQINGVDLMQHMRQIFKQTGIENIYQNDKHNIADIIADKGPLSGIYASMVGLKNDYEFIIFSPIDMPALSNEIIKKLMTADETYNIVRYNNFPLPFRLKLTQKTSELIKNILLNSTDYSLSKFQKKLSLFELEVPKAKLGNFININTPQEWKNYTKPCT